MGVKRNKERIVDKHLEFKRTSVKSENKIKDIKWILNLFFNSSKLDPSKFYENEVVKFINLISKKYSVRTQNDFKVVIKGFVKWFYPDYFTRFPNLDKICKIQKPEKARKPEDILSLKEIEMLINAEKDLFWKVFLLVFFYGGLDAINLAITKGTRIGIQEDCFYPRVLETGLGSIYSSSLKIVE